MKKRKTTSVLKFMAMILPLAAMAAFSACRVPDVTESETVTEPVEITASGITESRTSESTSVSVTTASSVETSESATATELNAEYVKELCVYSVWYDAVESNPVDYSSIESKDAFALKGVFYFSTPLTTVFQTRLYKDDSPVLDGEVKMKENVTAEADFSAGLAGLGTFEPGEYHIELLFDGETVASTSKMRVR